MAGEKPGTITTQIRIDLAQMEKDGLQAQRMMDHYAKKFKALGKNGGTLYVSGFGHAQLDLNKKLNNMVSSMQGVSPALGVLGDKMAKAFSAPIFSMIPAVSSAFTTILGAIGPIISVASALASVIKKIIDRQKENTKAIKASTQATESLKNMTNTLAASQNASADVMEDMAFSTVRAYQNVKKEMEELSRRRLELDNEILKAQNDKYEKNYKLLHGYIASEEERLKLMQEIEEAEKYEIKCLEELNEAAGKYTNATNEEIRLRREVKDAKEAAKNQTKELINEINNYEAAYKTQIRIIANEEQSAAKSAVELARERTAAAEKYRDSLIQTLTVAQSLAPYDDDAKEKVKELKEAITELNKELKDSAAKEYEQQMNDIAAAERLGIIGKQEALKRTLELHNQEIDALFNEWTLLNNILDKNDAADRLRLVEQENLIRAKVEERDKLEALIETEGKQNKEKSEAEIIEEKRLDAVEKFKKAERKVRDDVLAGLIDEKEAAKQIEAALAQQYSDLQAIADEHRNATGEAEAELKTIMGLRDATAAMVVEYRDTEKLKENQRKMGDLFVAQGDTLVQQEIDRQNALASSAKTEEERNAAMDEAIRLENDLILMQRQRARDALLNSEEYIAASEEMQIETLRQFDAITDGMMKVREEADAQEEGSWLANALGITDKQLNNIMETGGAVIDALSNIADAAMEVSRKNAEEQIALVEEQLQKMTAAIEEARQAELEANGFIEASGEEELQRQIDRAKEAGDEVLQYQLERKKQEMEINKKYEDQIIAAEEKAAKEKADIEFRLAKQEYAMQMINAVNAGAMAVLNALKGPPGPPISFVLAGAAGIAAGVQIGLLAANPPKPPAFANGGIVPGNMFAGDRVHAMVDSGELILNRAGQDSIADQLTQGGTTLLTVIMQVDSMELARASAEVYGSGQVTVPVRGIDR